MIYLKKIPETSKELYISGYEALNTPDSSGVPADWHPRLYWYSEVEGEYIKLYSNPILGDEGIEERSLIYAKEKVFIATHVRAMADLVFHTENLDILTGFVNDYAFDEKQKEEVFNMLMLINKHKNIDNFIKYEMPKQYLRYKRMC